MTKLEQAAKMAVNVLEGLGYDPVDLREALAEPVRKCDGLLCNDCGEYKQKYKDLPGLTEKDLCVCEQAEHKSTKECAKRMKRLFERDGCYLYAQMINLESEQAEQEPEYDLSNVIHLTHNKAKHIIKSRGYSVTGFVLTREDGGKCIVDMSAVRWFDDKLVFQRMMHSDTPKEWLSPPVEHVKQEPVGVVTKEALDGVVKWNGWIPREGTKIYAAPVRTKDLTDTEIEAAVLSVNTTMEAWITYRAVIAADRELNK